MKLAAGSLNHRITIQQSVVDQDSDGNVIESWEPFAETWANVRPASVREFIAAAIQTSQVTVAVQTRYIADVKPSMQIVHGDHVYNIEGVLPDPQSGKEWMTMPCSEVVNG